MDLVNYNIKELNMFSSARHISQLILIVFLVFITIVSGSLWRYFFILPFSAFMIYLTDVMFLGQDEFMYEPNYNTWVEKNTEDY